MVKKIIRRCTLAILVMLALAAIGLAGTDQHRFSVGSIFGDRDVFDFEVRTPGTIRVEARWTGSASNLALILNGPGQEGHYQRIDGRSPLAVTQQVTRAILARGTRWKASIVNFSRKGAAIGTATVNYPGGDPGGPDGPGGPGGPGGPDDSGRHGEIHDRFDRLILTRVEQADNRAVLAVEYALGSNSGRYGGHGFGWHDTNAVYLGAAALINGRESSWFGSQPVRLNQRGGTARITLVYQSRYGPLRVSTDQIAVFLYEGREKPFCKLIHDLDLDWRR